MGIKEGVVEDEGRKQERSWGISRRPPVLYTLEKRANHPRSSALDDGIALPGWSTPEESLLGMWLFITQSRLGHVGILRS